MLPYVDNEFMGATKIIRCLKHLYFDSWPLTKFGSFFFQMIINSSTWQNREKTLLGILRILIVIINIKEHYVFFFCNGTEW